MNLYSIEPSALYRSEKVRGGGSSHVSMPKTIILMRNETERTIVAQDPCEQLIFELI